jgi:hypothetical protein
MSITHFRPRQPIPRLPDPTSLGGLARPECLACAGDRLGSRQTCVVAQHSDDGAESAAKAGISIELCAEFDPVTAKLRNWRRRPEGIDT